MIPTAGMLLHRDVQELFAYVTRSREAGWSGQSHRGFVWPRDQNEPNLWPRSRKGWQEPKLIIGDTHRSQHVLAPECVCYGAILIRDVETCILSGQYVLIRLSSLWSLGLVMFEGLCCRCCVLRNPTYCPTDGTAMQHEHTHPLRSSGWL